MAPRQTIVGGKQMNQLTEQQMRVHIPIVAWLLIASSALFLLIACFVFVLLVGIGMAVGEADAARVLTIVATFAGGLLAVLALPGVAAGIGLLTHQKWARILAIVVAVLGLLNFPIGTLIGVYAIWVLLQEAATAYFEPPTAAAEGMT